MRPMLLPAIAGVFSLSVAAQELPIEQPQTAQVVAFPVGAPGPDVPPPPKALLHQPHKHGMPPIPVGTSALPQPENGPIGVVMEGEDAGGDYVVFKNPNVKPSGTSTSNVGEPDVKLADSNNGLLTGNWHVSRTQDGGSSWTRINPYTRFPASYGGFCCDQRVATEDGVTVWLLQYVANSSGNTQRVAVADTPSALGSDNFARYYDFTAQTFGYASGDWLDYPDIAATNEYFYFSSNVFSQGGSFRGAVIWRGKVADFKAGGTLSVSYIDSPGASRGASFRFTQGARGDMFIGSHVNTSRLRVIRWQNVGGFITYERDVSAWTSGSSAAPGPDGRNWTGRADNRITGGYSNDEEFGFVWHVNATTNRPFNYLRLARFSHDVTLIGQRDIFGSTFALMYPAAATNAWGHLAIIAGIGGGTIHPSTCTLLQDDLENFATARLFSTSDSGPDRNVWGDYYGVSRHPSSTEYGTFYGTGMRQSGGGANGNSVPEYVHFGREAFGPSYVGLVARSVPSGVNLSLTGDAFGQGGGQTPFYRAYAISASYTATAPSVHVAGSVRYLFHRWAWKSVADTAWSEQPIGQLSISFGIGAIDDGIEARYLRERVLAVGSTNPSSGVAITVSPGDFNGSGNGTTSFNRTYWDGSVVTLTAPNGSGCNPFARWRINGTAQPAGQTTVQVTMSGDVTAIAEYSPTVLGRIQPLGGGCRGSNGRIPNQVITHKNGSCGPLQGTPTTYELRDAAPNTLSVLHIGWRTDVWGGFRLPLDLGAFGAPGCFLDHDIIVSPSASTNSRGDGQVSFTWPLDRNAQGMPFHTTFAVVDRGANHLGVVHSNSMTTSQGGSL